MTQTLVADLRARAPVWRLPDSAADELRAAAPEGWRAVVLDSPTISDGDGAAAASEEALSAVRGADAYVGFGMPRTLFAAGERLRWIHSAAAGVGSLLFDELRASDVMLTNSAGIHAEPMAEHVLAGVLALLRGLDVASEAKREVRWERAAFVGEESQVRELRECRALVIGAGGTGSAIARALGAFGVVSTGVRRRPELGVPAGFHSVIGPDELDAALPSADLLILAAPSTQHTRAMVTGDRLASLPAGAIVVNVARGSLVDENALIEALRSGRLRGAVLDVFQEEPLPVASELWRIPSVVLTPHISAVSPRGFWKREMELITDNWRRLHSREPLRNLVDKNAGY